MKTLLTLLAICACAASNAAPAPSASFSKALANAAADASRTSFEAKGRTGSRRVGGSSRSGKGGKYVGGRK